MAANGKKKKEIFVRIQESKLTDAGRGFARVDPEIQKNLSLHVGDGIALVNPTNNYKTAALIKHGCSEYRGTKIVWIDGSLRHNLKAHGIDVSNRSIQAYSKQIGAINRDLYS